MHTVASLVEHGLCGAWAAVVAAPRFQSTGSIMPLYGCRLPCSIWDLPAGLNLRSPKLAGRFFTLSYEGSTSLLPLKMLMAEQSLRRQFTEDTESTMSQSANILAIAQQSQAISLNPPPLSLLS